MDSCWTFFFIFRFEFEKKKFKTLGSENDVIFRHEIFRLTFQAYRPLQLECLAHNSRSITCICNSFKSKKHEINPAWYHERILTLTSRGTTSDWFHSVSEGSGPDATISYIFSSKIDRLYHKVRCFENYHRNVIVCLSEDGWNLLPCGRRCGEGRISVLDRVSSWYGYHCTGFTSSAIDLHQTSFLGANDTWRSQPYQWERLIEVTGSLKGDETWVLPSSFNQFYNCVCLRLSNTFACQSFCLSYRHRRSSYRPCW